MKYKISILLCFLVLNYCTAFLVYNYIFFTKGDKVEFLDITYKYVDENKTSCLTFKKNQFFIENNCSKKDSKMQFSGNYCNKYSYDKTKQTITFYCKNTLGKKWMPKKVIANILKWNNSELKIKYNDYYEGLVIVTYNT